MKKSTKYTLASLTSALAAMLVSTSMRNAHSMSALYSYILMSIALLGLAAVLAAMGLIELSEEVKKPRKIHCKPQHTVQPNNNRKAG